MELEQEILTLCKALKLTTIADTFQKGKRGQGFTFNFL